jgi:hypothetical protein
MIKVFKQLKAFFFQWLSTGIFALLFVSCVSYYPTSYRAESVSCSNKSRRYYTSSYLSELRRQYNYNTYSDWQFYYGNNNWYLWSDWRLRYPSYNLWYNDWYRPYGRTFRYYNQPKTRYIPRREVPQTRPQTRPQRPRVATPRGSRSEYTPRTPQRIQRNTTPTRTQTTPNVQTRTNVGRSSNGVKQKQ